MTLDISLDTARQVANVHCRAQRLYEDGYTAVWIEEGYELSITNEEGTSYTVNTLLETCTCPYWTTHQGKRQCKHLLGWERLLLRQARAGGIRFLLGQEVPA